MVVPSLSSKIKDEGTAVHCNSFVTRKAVHCKSFATTKETKSASKGVVQFETTRRALEGDRDAARNELRLCNDRSGFSLPKKPPLFDVIGTLSAKLRKVCVFVRNALLAKNPSLHVPLGISWDCVATQSTHLWSCYSSVSPGPIAGLQSCNTGAV